MDLSDLDPVYYIISFLQPQNAISIGSALVTNTQTDTQTDTQTMLRYPRSPTFRL